MKVLWSFEMLRFWTIHLSPSKDGDDSGHTPGFLMLHGTEELREPWCCLIRRTLSSGVTIISVDVVSLFSKEMSLGSSLSFFKSSRFEYPEEDFSYRLMLLFFCYPNDGLQMHFTTPHRASSSTPDLLSASLVWKLLKLLSNLTTLHLT